MRLKSNPSYAQLHEDVINTLSDCGFVELVEEPTREANTLDLIISNCPQLHEDFINTLSDFGLVQLVEEPTREANTLDLIISNCPQLIPSVGVLPGLSDHGAVFCEIKVHTQMRKQTSRQIPLYAQADWGELRATITNLHEKEEKSTASTEELWTLFRDKLQTAIKGHIPHKQARVKGNKPWVSPALRRLIKKRDRVFKKMRKQGTEELKQQNKHCVEKFNDSSGGHTGTTWAKHLKKMILNRPAKANDPGHTSNIRSHQMWELPP